VSKTMFGDPGLEEFVVERGRVFSIATREFLEG
jgi:hypothetical protein